MKLSGFLCIIFFASLFISTTKTSAVSVIAAIGAAKDIVDLVHGVVNTVKDIWQLVDTAKEENNMSLIVQRLDEISKEIKKTEDRVCIKQRKFYF